MKEYIPWSNVYSVQIPSIDAQHKKLIDLINLLHHQLMENPNDKQIIGEAIQELFDYAQEHFSYEESLLKEHDYPDYFKHKSEHRAFKKKIKSYSKDSELELHELLFFLQSWLITHIKGVDSKYSAFLTERKVQ